MAVDAALQELRMQESEYVERLKRLEERKAQLLDEISTLKRQLDTVRNKYRKAKDVYDSYRFEKELYNLSRRIAPYERELSEVEMKIRGLKTSLENVRRRIKHLEFQKRSKWVREEGGS